MRRLWIADIHANLPAFEAVLADAGAVDEIVFLGDIVGYGPHPSGCLDLLKQLDAKTVMGNHDARILSMQNRPYQRSMTLNWDAWTFDQLDKTQLLRMKNLPEEISINFCGIISRAMHHPYGVPYLHPDMPDSVLARHLNAVPHTIVICGHSHRMIDRTVNGLRYICVPPVGQPRNGDARAGYALENDGLLAFNFVQYDIEQVVADVKRIGLAPEFCQRWISFLRTGFDAEWSREYSQGDEPA